MPGIDIYNEGTIVRVEIPCKFYHDTMTGAPAHDSTGALVSTYMNKPGGDDRVIEH